MPTASPRSDNEVADNLSPACCGRVCYLPPIFPNSSALGVRGRNGVARQLSRVRLGSRSPTIPRFAVTLRLRLIPRIV